MSQKPISGIPVGCRSLLWVFLFFSFFSSYLLRAQSDSIQDPTEFRPKVLGSSEIAAFGQTTRDLINNVKRLESNADRLQEIRELLFQDDSVVQAKTAILTDTLVDYSMDKLEILEYQLRNLEKELIPLSREIRDWREITNRYASDIGYHAQTWQLTLDSLNRVEETTDWSTDSDRSRYLIFNRIKNEISSNVSSIKELEEEITVWNRDLIKTENALTLTFDGLNKVFTIISRKREALMENIWTPEYPPLWKMTGWQNKEVTNENISEQFQNKWNTTFVYIRSKQSFYYGLLFWFIAIFGLIVYIKHKSPYVQSRRNSLSPHERIVLKHPLVVTYVIILFAILLQEVELPRISYLLIFISILPFSILIWELNDTKKVQRVTSFVFFSLLFVGLGFIVLVPNLLRVSLLFINGLLLFQLIHFGKDEIALQSDMKYWFGTMKALKAVFIFFNGLAILANILGSLQLAVILTKATIGTLIAYVVLRECVLVIQGFLHLVLLGPVFKKSRILQDDAYLVIRQLNKLLRLVGYVIWVYITLDLLQIRETLINRLIEYISKPLQIGELSISLGNVLAFFVIIQISIWLSRLIRYVLQKEIFPRTKISSGSASTFSLLTKYTITFIGFLFALAGAGIELSKVVLGFSALGIGIGFGLQNIINNFVSGIILAVERPFKLGDVVRVDDIEGIVINIGLRASQIRQWNGSNVLVPNGDLISGKLTNWTYEEKSPRRLDIGIHLPIGTDVYEVKELLLETAKNVKGIMDEPGVAMNHEGVQDGELVLRLYAWIGSFYDGFTVGTALKTAVFKTLLDHGYEITMPKLDITVNDRQTPGQ